MLGPLLTLATVLAATDFKVGDVFAAIGNGEYVRLSPAGTRLETLSIGTSDNTTGCGFDLAGNFYGTGFESNRLVRLDSAHPHSINWSIATPGVSGAIPDSAIESVIAVSGGKLLSGHAGIVGEADVHAYDLAGNLLDEYPVATEVAGSDWLDLASDGCTLFYTSEGGRILRWDLCTRSALPDFATIGPSVLPVFALRLLPPGDGSGGLIAADSTSIKRLDRNGSLVRTYDAPGEDAWFALNLDPDGMTFWSGDSTTGNLYRFDIATGAIRTGPILVSPTASFFGLCVYGELTAASCATVKPERVGGLVGVRAGRNAGFQWTQASDTVTTRYDVWKVIDGDKTLIPRANATEAETNPAVKAVCLRVPKLTPDCSDANALNPPPLLFYQVRGACESGVEGTDHPF